MEDLEIMKAVIAKQAPDLKLDDESEEFVRGVFKTLAATRVDTAKEIQKLVNAGKEQPKGDETWEQEADKARTKAIQQMQDAWKPKELRDAEKEMRDQQR